MISTSEPAHPDKPTTKRVLIVEDEPLIAYDLRTEIEANGHIVVGQCADSDAAIAMAGELRPDAVIMDIGLTGKHTGLDAAREIRSTYDIGCIFVSATLDRVDPRIWNDIRPIALIRKPYRDDALAAAIAKTDSNWEAVGPAVTQQNKVATPDIVDEAPSTPTAATKTASKSQNI